MDWDWLRQKMLDCPWSPEACEAGLWSLDVLQRELGPAWPKAWQEPGCAPPELAACWYSLSGFAYTLDLALGSALLRNMPGMRSMRTTVSRTARADALASPRLQLRMACLALAQDLDVELEPRLPGAETRADLLVSCDQMSLGIEAFAVLRDEKTLAASKWLDGVTVDLHQIAIRHRINFQGAVDAPLDDHETANLLAELDRRAALVDRGLEFPALRMGGVSLLVLPATGQGGTKTIRMPTVSFDLRLERKLRAKAEQTRRSSAEWLLVDFLDHLWRMTAWDRQPLPDKARALADLLQKALNSEDHLLGVVLTDGAALMRPEVEEETVELAADGGVVARRRRIDNWRVRESVIVPLRSDARESAKLWGVLLDAESGWLAEALESAGLPMPSELAPA
jgi:hypothetical protein